MYPDRLAIIPYSYSFRAIIGSRKVEQILDITIAIHPYLILYKLSEMKTYWEA